MKLLIKLILLTLVFSISSYAQNVKTYIPERAFEYRDQLYNEMNDLTPYIPDYNYLPALIEHESCISLKHSRCWSPTSELNNKREYSVGFFQIAKAYNADGSLRMDTLSSLKRKYKDRLNEATWENLKYRPDLQFKAGLTLIDDIWGMLYEIKDPNERMKFLDNAYNGGIKWVLRERTACGLAKGCDPNVWYNNVENYCQRSKNPIKAYGNRSICDISRNHTRDVFEVRMPKYQKNYFNDSYLKTNERK